MNRRALLLLPVLAVCTEAFAQSTQMTPAMYWGGLKQHMHIKPRQEAAWKKYTATMDQMAAKGGGHDSVMLDAMGTATWQERCGMINRTLKGPEATAVARKAAAELGPVLDKSQRTVAPAMLPGFALPPGPGFG